MKHKKSDIIISAILLIGILWTIRLFFEEVCYDQKVEHNYYAALYSVSLAESDNILQEELRFEASLAGVCTRNFIKDFIVEGKVDLLLEQKIISFRFSSDYIRKIDRFWRTINMYNPIYFGWDLFNVKRIYYAKDFSILLIPLFPQSKIIVLSEEEIDDALLKELPMQKIIPEFRDVQASTS